MPFRFPCEHCGQTLKVSTKKIGKSESCPACKRVLVVPPIAEAAARFKARKQAQPVGGDGEPDSLGGGSEFVVYDDDTELVYETDDAPLLERAPIAPASVDLNKVAVPRLMLYLQGGLLAVVALAAFGLGIVVGGGFTSSPVVVNKERSFALTGKLQHRSGGRVDAPDEGAVVLVLPVDSRPERERKLPTSDLLPAAAAPPADAPALKMLRELGGDYARADASGSFRVQLPRLGSYYVLLISRATPAPRSSQLDEEARIKQREDLAKMGGYFDDAPLIAARQAYQWKVEKFNTDAERSFTFGE